MANPVSNFPNQFPNSPIGSNLRGEQLTSLTSVLQQAFVPLTHSQLTSLNTTPIEVIPTPGPNKAVVVMDSIYQLKYSGGNSFVSTDQGPGLYYGLFTANADGSDGNSFFVNTEDQIIHGPSLMTQIWPSDVSNLAIADMQNQPIIFGNASSDMSDGGNSTGSVSVLYYVVDIG